MTEEWGWNHQGVIITAIVVIVVRITRVRITIGAVRATVVIAWITVRFLLLILLEFGNIRVNIV